MGKALSEEYIRSAVSKYSDTVFRVAYQYVKNRADAEDIVQEVFYVLLKQEQFDDESHLKNWLVRVAINKSINAYKAIKIRRKRVTEYVDELSPADRGDGALKYVLDELPPSDREVVYLHYYEGYTTKEIGGLIKKSEAAVQKQLSRARGKLKKYLEED